MKHILNLLIVIIFHQAYSQEFKREFGIITQAELDYNSCEKDKDAGAVVLFDIGKSVFFDTDDGYDIRFTRHKRIKIFDKSAYEYAEVSIPFYVDGHGRTEIITSIEATTYNFENGSLKIQMLDPKNVYEEKPGESWRVKKFVFPNVREGSIIEFRYILETPFHFNMPDWTFQDYIPTLYSEYEVSMIPFYEYIFLAQGISRFHKQTSVVSKITRSWGNTTKAHGNIVGNGIEFQDYVHTYSLKDIPAFKDESYISSVNDYIIKIDFQLAKFYSPYGGSKDVISTWPELNETLLKDERFGKYQKNCTRYAKKILDQDLNLEGKSEIEKSIGIINYVKNNFNWNGHSSKYASQSAKEFITNKSGNSADINLFMLALLDQAEIESNPVVLSTRSHGKIKSDYPFDHFTNYVIALVNTDSPYLADGTENLLAYNRIPPRCYNEKGLIVSENEQEDWLKLENNIPSLENHIISIEVDTESIKAAVDILIQSTGYEAYFYRSEYKNDTIRLKEFFTEKIGDIDRLQSFGYSDESKPYTIAIEGKCEIEKIGENIVVNPFLNFSISKNKLTQKNRSYPVDFIYPKNEHYEITLAIPEGFKIANLPEPFNMDNDLAEINLKYSINGNLLKIEGNYSFKKAIYISIEYARIKNYFDTIVKKFNEQIVMEKI